jgi:hypothetical protein
MWKKVLISVFAVLNICCVLISNKPNWLERASERVSSGWDPYTQWRIQQLQWGLRTYAFLVGLDNYWTLFSYLPRFNHWYSITATYTDGSTRLLPLPMQGDRTFWERYFFDFRAAKYYLNIYNQTFLMDRYGRYLCKRFAEYGSAQAVSVTIELYHQNILPREVARKRHTPVEPQAYHRTFSHVSCLDPG